MAASVCSLVRQNCLRVSLLRTVCSSKPSRAVLSSLSVRSMSSDIIDPPYLGPSVPNYKVREGEAIETKRSRLLYQSRKRGMLENGLLLSTFANKYLKTFDAKSLELYDKLINQPSNDWDIYYWMTDNQPTPDEYNNHVMDLLKEHTRNDNMDVRIRQPDLGAP